MTLREKAQEWLKNYKGAGNAYGGNILSLEEMATIVSEYLYKTDPRKKAEGTSERVEELQVKAELLHEDLIEAQNEAEELRKKNEELRSHIHMVEREMDRMGGQIAAYKFVIRCNGVSGAEVRP